MTELLDLEIPADIVPYAPQEIDVRVLRQRAVLARIRDVDSTAIDVMTSRLETAITNGKGREDLFAALLVVAQRDDLYDALAQQRQAEVLGDFDKTTDPGWRLLQGLLRVAFVAPTMSETVAHIVEAAILAEDSRGTAYDFFLVWAGACRHRWLWEILHAAHDHSLASRRAL